MPEVCGIAAKRYTEDIEEQYSLFEVTRVTPNVDPNRAASVEVVSFDSDSGSS